MQQSSLMNRNLSLVTAGLGLWVVITTFFFRTTTPTFVNAWVTGVVIVVSALIGLRLRAARYISAAAGVWLIASMFAWPNYTSPMIWSNFFVGAAVTLVSMVGPQEADIVSS
jgi:hypothetical protein